MRTVAVGTGYLIAFALAVMLAACDGPTRPSSGPPQAPPPSGPTLIRLEIGGPATVAPGETAQFTAAEIYSDGSKRNVASEPGIVWVTSNPRVLAISASGVASGGDRGEATLSASFGGRMAVKNGVLVLPPGTYRLTGRVTDTGFALGGVRVEVTQGSATGQNTVASPEFALYGVSGDTEIRASKAGYRDERRRIQVDSHATADIEMVPSAPRENVEGTYTLTVTATGACDGVPEEARVRTFTAVLTQQGPRVTARLEGSTFLTANQRTRNTFWGTLEAEHLTFFMQEPFTYYYFYYSLPDVMELLVPDTYFYMGGGATTRRTGNGHSGTLSGVIGTMEGLPRLTQLSSCRSNAHRFELVRR